MLLKPVTEQDGNRGPWAIRSDRFEKGLGLFVRNLGMSVYHVLLGQFGAMKKKK